MVADCCVCRRSPALGWMRLESEPGPSHLNICLMGRQWAWNQKTGEREIKKCLNSTTDWIITLEGLKWDDINRCPVWSYNSTEQSDGNTIAHYAAPDSLRSRSHGRIVTFGETDFVISWYGIKRYLIAVCVCVYVCVCHTETKKSNNNVISAGELFWYIRVCVCLCLCVCARTCIITCV